MIGLKFIGQWILLPKSSTFTVADRGRKEGELCFGVVRQKIPVNTALLKCLRFAQGKFNEERV